MSRPEARPSLQAGDALLILDVQNDFLPGGSLAVDEGDAVLAPLNRMIDAFTARGLPVYATRDWHPPDHMSFKAQGGPWPRHCIAGTAGAAFPAALRLPLVPQVPAVEGQKIKSDERRGRLAGELRDARRGGMQAQLQGVEVEAARGGDDDLAVEHAGLREALEQRVVQLREVAVEGAQVAALEEDICTVAEHDRAESVPLGLVEPARAGREAVGEPGEHGLDRRFHLALDRDRGKVIP